MKRIILFCISLVAWFSLPGLLLGLDKKEDKNYVRAVRNVTD